MTKTLTEQWREGTLPTGYYYFNNGKETHAGCYIQGEYCSDDITVIDPVPSYDEWKQAKENLDKNGTWYTERAYKELVSKTEQLEKKLEIATKALKSFIPDDLTDGGFGEMYESVILDCEKAIKEMEGVK